MADKSLSEKEAAFLAAARREMQQAKAAPADLPASSLGAKSLNSAFTNGTKPPSLHAPPNEPPPAKTAAPLPRPLADVISATSQSTAIAPSVDLATRMALLMEAEREAGEARKRRVKRTYTLIVCAIMIPAFLYVATMMFKMFVR